MGALHDRGDTIMLFGPREPGFWAHVTGQPEFADGLPDPLDRWSRRAIDALAAAWGGQAVFPSDGPPYAPFQAWALASGRCFASPVGLLVHPEAGLWVSFRGAIRLPGLRPCPPPAKNPCDTCISRPCLEACPVDAFGASGYDVPACKTHLRSPEGEAGCMARGCAVRRACPVSRRHGRLEAQSAFHMRAFLS